MSVQVVRGKKDKGVRAFAATLGEYARRHPDARIELYRHSIGLIRVRVVDPAFKGLRWGDRDQEIWPLMEQMPLDTLNELDHLVLVTPDEIGTWPVSVAFDNPEPLDL